MADITYPTKNTGDAFTAAEANEVKTAVNSKVDKVAGKGLSTNDYTDSDKDKVANLPSNTNTALAGKVDTVSGKGLSTNDYTNAEKSKLAGLSITYVGTFTDLGTLESAYPTGQPGYEAIIDGGAGIDPQKAFWDSSDSEWKLQTGGGASSFSELAGSPNDNTALAAALDAKASSTHTHAISNVTGLQTALDGKANDTEVVKISGNQTVGGVKDFVDGFCGKYVRGANITGNITLDASHANKLLYVTEAAVITVPNSIFSANQQIRLIRKGAGEVSFAAGSGHTIESAGNRLRIAERHGPVELIFDSASLSTLIGGTKV